MKKKLLLYFIISLLVNKIELSDIITCQSDTVLVNSKVNCYLFSENADITQNPDQVNIINADNDNLPILKSRNYNSNSKY
jgi:hypothetical protein